MDRKKFYIILSLVVLSVLIALAAIFRILSTRELTLIFPEMNTTQKGYITPLITGFELNSRFEVSCNFGKDHEISKNPRYVINNYQLQELFSENILSGIDIRKNMNVPDIFYSNDFYIPISWYPWGIYYNKSVFRELGLEVPGTWDQFIELCENLKNGGYFPISLMTKIKWPSTLWFDYLNIEMNGGDFHIQVLSGEVAFTDKRVKAVFYEMLNLHEKEYIYIDAGSFKWQEMISSLEEKVAVMHLSGSFFYENASDSFREELGWFPFPVVKEGESDTVIASSSGFIFPKDIVNKTAAQRFLEFTQSEEGQGIIMRNSNLLPVNSEVSRGLGRNDLSAAVKSLENKKFMLPSFERNTHPDLLIPLKSAISSIYSKKDKASIDFMLEKLEELRLKK